MTIIGILAGILLVSLLLLSKKKKAPSFQVVITPTPSPLPGHSYWKAGEYECEDGYCSTFKGVSIVIVPEQLSPEVRKAVFDINHPESIFLLEEKLDLPVLNYKPVTSIAGNCKEACNKLGKS